MSGIKNILATTAAAVTVMLSSVATAQTNNPTLENGSTTDADVIIENGGLSDVEIIDGLLNYTITGQGGDAHQSSIIIVTRDPASLASTVETLGQYIADNGAIPIITETITNPYYDQRRDVREFDREAYISPEFLEQFPADAEQEILRIIQTILDSYSNSEPISWPDTNRLRGLCDIWAERTADYIEVTISETPDANGRLTLREHEGDREWIISGEFTNAAELDPALASDIFRIHETALTGTRAIDGISAYFNLQNQDHNQPYCHGGVTFTLAVDGLMINGQPIAIPNP